MGDLRIHIAASNDHDDLAIQLHAWLARVMPKRIHHVALAADGTDFSYVVLIVFS